MSDHERKTIYVGSAIAQTSEEYRNHIAALKNALKEEYRVLDYVGPVGGTPKDVFEHDISCVRNGELFVAEVSLPSTGLGVEIAEAHYVQVPTLAVAMEGTHVSRLVQGITYPLFTFHRYSEIQEVVGFVRERFVALGDSGPHKGTINSPIKGLSSSKGRVGSQAGMNGVADYE
jgi:hypothetical protein